MNMDLITFTGNAIRRNAEEKILACNDYLSAYGDGLSLTKADAALLLATRESALKNAGRVEFGGGCIEKLAKAFCTSPDIQKEEFVTVLSDLVDIFYSYKNETDYVISDDELIEAMRQAFDGSCHGSVALLAAKSAREILQLSLTGEDEENPDDAPLSEPNEEDML